MKDFNEIDNLFHNAIEPLEFTPSDNVWQSVQGKLQKKSALAKEKTIRNLRFSVAASVTAFCLAVAYHYYTPQNQNTIAALPSDTKTIAGKLIHSSSTPVANNTTNTSSLNANQNKALASKNEVQNTTTQQITVAPAETPGNDNVVSVPLQKTPGLTNDVNHKENTTIKNNQVISPVIIADNTAKKENTVTQNNNNDVQKKSIDIVAPNVEAKEIVYVPNAFTPNGDGKNDVFMPEAAEELKEYKLTIFNYQGNIVFATDDITKGWDGKTQTNGLETVKEDVYIWRIELRTAKNEAHQFKGTLTLVK